MIQNGHNSSAPRLLSDCSVTSTRRVTDDNSISRTRATEFLHPSRCAGQNDRSTQVLRKQHAKPTRLDLNRLGAVIRFPKGIGSTHNTSLHNSTRPAIVSARPSGHQSDQTQLTLRRETDNAFYRAENKQQRRSVADANFRPVTCNSTLSHAQEDAENPQSCSEVFTPHRDGLAYAEEEERGKNSKLQRFEVPTCKKICRFVKGAAPSHCFRLLCGKEMGLLIAGITIGAFAMRVWHL